MGIIYGVILLGAVIGALHLVDAIWGRYHA